MGRPARRRHSTPDAGAIESSNINITTPRSATLMPVTSATLILYSPKIGRRNGTARTRREFLDVLLNTGAIRRRSSHSRRDMKMSYAAPRDIY